MPRHAPSSLPEEQSEAPLIERPLTHGLAPFTLTGEQLMLIPLMPDHQYKLYTEIFSKPKTMQYFVTGKSFTSDEYSTLHMESVRQNLTLQYDHYSGCVSRFNWTIITKDGIAGRFYMFPTEGRTELGFCISPTQQGRALARRASELVVEYAGEEASFIATAHPLNKASSKTLEQVHFPDGKFVFFRDPKRQNVSNKYGEHQPRDYFLSHRQSTFSFFSFTQGQVHIDMSKELEDIEKTHVLE